MTTASFVTFTNALLGAVAAGSGTIRVSTQAPIAALFPITPGTAGTDATLAAVTMISFGGAGPSAFVSGSVTTVASTLSGIAQAGPTFLCNTPIGNTALGSLGTDAVSVIGTQYYSELIVPCDRTCTNLAALNGSTAATDHVIYFICNNAGAVLGTTDLAGTLCATQDAFQQIALLTPVSLTAGRYWAGFQVDGTTTKHRTIAASTFQTVTGSIVGAFGVIAAITPSVTVTAGVGPFMRMS